MKELLKIFLCIKMLAEHDMEKTAIEFLRFGDVEIEKTEFCHSKKAINIDNVDLKKY